MPFLIYLAPICTSTLPAPLCIISELSFPSRHSSRRTYIPVPLSPSSTPTCPHETHAHTHVPTQAHMPTRKDESTHTHMHVRTQAPTRKDESLCSPVPAHRHALMSHAPAKSTCHLVCSPWLALSVCPRRAVCPRCPVHSCRVLPACLSMSRSRAHSLHPSLCRMQFACTLTEPCLRIIHPTFVLASYTTDPVSSRHPCPSWSCLTAVTSLRPIIHTRVHVVS